MPTGRVRSTGGLGRGRLCWAVKLASLRPYRLSKAPPCTLAAARRDRERLRREFAFYLAKSEGAVTSTKLLAAERRLRTAAKRLLDAPCDLGANANFHAAYEALPTQGRQRFARVLHRQGLNFYKGRQEEDHDVLGAIAVVDLPAPNRTRSRNPALIELAMQVSPIWKTWTGRSIWPANMEAAKKSLFAIWLNGLLQAANAPKGCRVLSSDMLHSFAIRNERKNLLASQTKRKK